jgi:hypothetical protein
MERGAGNIDRRLDRRLTQMNRITQIICEISEIRLICDMGLSEPQIIADEQDYTDNL